MQVATKICPGCNIEKSLDDFGKKGEGKQPLCKPCHNAKNKAYKNKTAILKPRDSNAILLDTSIQEKNLCLGQMKKYLKIAKKNILTILNPAQLAKKILKLIIFRMIAQE